MSGVSIFDILKKEIEALHEDEAVGMVQFIDENLSPGGSADLLGLCYLLHFLKEDPAQNSRFCIIHQAVSPETAYDTVKEK